jgi:hypothetical protein
MTLSTGALACLLLAQPAPAADTDGCQKTTARRLLGLGRQAGDCLMACREEAARGAGRDCTVGAPDAALASCLERARLKARTAIRRACQGNACPACYAGADCDTFADEQIEAAVAASGLAASSFFCDDGGSADGLTDAEARCRAATWTELQRFARQWLRCRTAGGASACVERAVDEVTAALRKPCRDVPECAPFDAESTSTLAYATAGMLAPWASTIFCQASCGDGVLGAGEECDPRAAPTGCDAGRCVGCRCLALCGDGAWNGHETCDESAPASDDGCDAGFQCTACLYCHPVCGDGVIASNAYAAETCEPPGAGCPAGETCVSCTECGTPADVHDAATEDLTPCTDTIADRWTFEVEGGAIVTVTVDTTDAATAANLRIEGGCGGRHFGTVGGAACTFAPPHPHPSEPCPAVTFVAPASGTCTLGVGVRDLDPDYTACRDSRIARYRVSVSGVSLTLATDDASPGLSD